MTHSPIPRVPKEAPAAMYLMVLMLGMAAALPVRAQDAPEIQVFSGTGSWLTLPALTDGGTFAMERTTVGLATTRLLTIINEGTRALTIGGFSFDGPHAADFSVNPVESTNTVHPGQSYLFDLQCRPSAKGLRTAVLHITSDDEDEGSFDLTLTATGQIPKLRVTQEDGTEIPPGDNLTFPETTARYMSSGRIFYVNNVGEGSLSYGASLQGQDSVNFRLLSSAGDVLPPGFRDSFAVSFIPVSAGQKTVTLKLITHGLNESHLITLTGTGVTTTSMTVEQPAGLALAQDAHVNFGAACVGTGETGVSRTFTVSNPGPGKLGIFRVAFDSATTPFILTQPPAAEVGPGSSTTFTVMFSPKAAGPATTRMDIHNSLTGFFQPFQLWLDGSGVTPQVAFDKPLHAARHGDAEGLVTLTRTQPEAPLSVVVVAAPYSDLNRTLVPAVAGMDYLMNGTIVNFAAGEVRKMVAVPLLAFPDRARLNRQLSLSVASTNPGVTLEFGQKSTILRILAADNTSPKLTGLKPDTGRVPVVYPIQQVQVTGRVSDGAGIDRVEVKLNSAAPLLATMTPYGHGSSATNPVVMSFSLPFRPVVGPNVIVVTVYDLAGNSTTETRTLTLVSKRKLYYQTADAENTSQGRLLGGLALTATPAATGTTGDAYTKMAMVEAGSAVKIVATPKGKDNAFNRWDIKDMDGHAFTYGGSALPVMPLTIAGNEVSFIMPDEDLVVKGEFTHWPWDYENGRTLGMHAELHPDSPGLANVASEGFLRGTITTAGSFTGKLLIKGLSVPVAAILPAQGGPAGFSVAGRKRDALPFPGGELRIAYSVNDSGLKVIVNHTTGGTSTGFLEIERYIRLNEYASPALLAAADNLPLTMMFGPAAGALPTATAPRGFGYATMKVTKTGLMILTGVLADGTPVTMSSPLMLTGPSGNQIVSPLFIQLPTPGGTTKLGLLRGTLSLDTTHADHDVSGALRWFRPAAASAKVLLYPAGWPAGLDVETVGAIYNPATTVQSALGLGAATTSSPGNARLDLQGGKLTAAITKTSFNIKQNAVVPLAPVDAAYTLAVGVPTGLFTGSFTPNWAQPATTKPAFKGVILQKGANRGGYGFFLNNAKGETAPESGSVLLGAAEE